MGEESGLRALLNGARSADERAREAAFEELMSLVMILVRSAMGRRLRDHRESADVSQSIARSFVADYDAGKVEFASEAALVAYLKQVVRTKLAMLARHDGAVKRGGGAGNSGGDGAPLEGVGAATRSGEESPSHAAREDEALERALAGLSEEEQTLVRMRARGLSWERIAEEMGKDAAALRKQFSRARERMGEG